MPDPVSSVSPTAGADSTATQASAGAVADVTTQGPSRSTSATTGDVPAFGWSAYAERVNCRFAMLGFEIGRAHV